MSRGAGPLGAGLVSRNTIGIEFVAKNNADVLPIQVEAAKAFIAQYYPTTPVLGHGQVNPTGRQASEGMAVVNAINAQRSASGANPPSAPTVARGPTPANVRSNNPGALKPGAAAQLFDTTGTSIIGRGNTIATFPSPVHGAAANMTNLATQTYVGKTIGQIGRTWTGGAKGGVIGYNPNTVVTAQMMRDPAFMIPFMQAIARNEGGVFPMSDAQWGQAFDWYMAGGVPANTQTVAVAPPVTPPVVDLGPVPPARDPSPVVVEPPVATRDPSPVVVEMPPVTVAAPEIVNPKDYNKIDERDLGVPIALPWDPSPANYQPPSGPNISIPGTVPFSGWGNVPLDLNNPALIDITPAPPPGVAPPTATPTPEQTPPTTVDMPPVTVATAPPYGAPPGRGAAPPTEVPTPPIEIEFPQVTVVSTANPPGGRGVEPPTAEPPTAAPPTVADLETVFPGGDYEIVEGADGSFYAVGNDDGSGRRRKVVKLGYGANVYANNKYHNPLRDEFAFGGRTQPTDATQFLARMRAAMGGRIGMLDAGRRYADDGSGSSSIDYDPGPLTAEALLQSYARRNAPAEPEPPPADDAGPDPRFKDIVLNYDPSKKVEWDNAALRADAGATRDVVLAAPRPAVAGADEAPEISPPMARPAPEARGVITATNIPPAAATSDPEARGLVSATSAPGGFGSFFERLTDRSPRRNIDPWLAIMQAGFGMMAGTSPHALVNIGKGGMVGVQNLSDQREQIRQDVSVEQRAAQLAETARQHKEALDETRRQHDEIARANRARENEARIGHITPKLITNPDTGEGMLIRNSPSGNGSLEVFDAATNTFRPLGAAAAAAAAAAATTTPPANPPANTGTETATPPPLRPHNYARGAPQMRIEQGVEIPDPAPIPGMSSEAIKFAADKFLSNGTLQAQRSGQGGEAIKTNNQRAAILNFAMAKADSLGVSHQDIMNSHLASPARSKWLLDRDGAKQVGYIGTTVAHLDTMKKLTEAVANGDIQTANAIMNAISRQFGGAKVTNLETAAQIVGAEVVKSIVPGGGGVHEREEAKRIFSNAKSPAQFREGIEVLHELLGGQLATKKRHAVDVLKIPEATFNKLVGERALEVLNKSQERATAPPPAGTPARPRAGAAGKAPPTPEARARLEAWRKTARPGDPQIPIVDEILGRQ
jgi:hypothetical protein